MSQPTANDIQNATLSPVSTHGLTRRASGLLVPESVARTREVWMPEESKLLRRLDRLLRSHGVEAVLRCTAPECREKPAITTQVEPDGTTTLVCGCKKRELR